MVQPRENDLRMLILKPTEPRWVNPSNRRLMVRCLQAIALLAGFAAPLVAQTYDFSLSVTQLEDGAQQVSWKLAAQALGSYSDANTYTHSTVDTAPTRFDHVGFLGGAALFLSASPSTSIDFKDLSVTLIPAGKPGP